MAATSGTVALIFFTSVVALVLLVCPPPRHCQNQAQDPVTIYIAKAQIREVITNIGIVQQDVS